MSKTVDEDVVEKPSITETIAKLRELLKEWNHHTPKTDRDKMVGAFHVTITRLSEQAAGLQGPSLTIWRKELESMPGAWRAISATLPSTCLIFGQLVANETSPVTVLKVHSILPE